MGKLSKEFLVQFSNLPGDTVKERQQNSFRLFHKYQGALNKSEKDLDTVAKNFKPIGHLEKILRIDFLIYFRRFKELYQELQNGDEITLSKIAKQDWFFQSAFKDIGAEEFANTILPAMSYTVKLKILRRLSLEEKQNDEIFDAVRERYGIFLATVFLPKCSASKISETLKSHPVKFTPSQLQIIYNKDPNLIYLYLEERTKQENDNKFMNHNCFFVFLAQKNPDMFTNLLDKYKFKIRLGNRTTKRYIDSHKETILAKPKTFVYTLRNDRLIRKLGYELKDLLFTTLPNESQMYWKSLLKYYPKKQRFPLYKSMYNTVYHHKFGENLNSITEDVLLLIPDPLEREKIAKLKLKKEESEDYFKYVTPKYCLNEFMEKLDQMTATERSNFVDIAAECCALNEDVDGLLKLCQLVAVRFKNDDRNIRNSLFVVLNDHMDILKKFNEEHWKYLEEMFAVTRAKETLYVETAIKQQYLGFLVKNNRPLKETLLKYADTDWILYLEYNCRHFEDPTIYKKVLIELMEVGYPKSDDELKAAHYDCDLVHICRKYNQKYPQNSISIMKNPRILRSVKHVLENSVDKGDYIDDDEYDGIHYVICRKGASKQLAELKKLYLKSLKRCRTLQGVHWFLKHDPKTLQENFNHFLANFVEVRGLNARKMWYLIKKYNHMDFDKKVVEFCITKLKEEGFEKKERLAKPLSILATPNSHLEFLRAYIPTSAKVDLTDDEQKDLYLIQCELLKFLHLVKSPATVLPFALQFFKGDYLKYALSPVYSSVCNLPESQTKVFIDKIGNDKAVSVKKHAMTLSCLIYDKDTVYNTLKNATVPSLLPSMKYFAKNPSETLWELVDQKLSNLEKKDIDALQGVISVKISAEYKSKFIEKVWPSLVKYDDNKIKKILMEDIDKSVVGKLDPQFSFKIIETSIFKVEEVDDFISNLFIHLHDKAKFERFAAVLTKFKENYWNRQDTRRVARHKLNSFIKTLFKIYMNLENSEEQFDNEFNTMFNSIFSPIETFEEFVIISFMKIKGETPENCAKFLIQLAKNLVKDYDKFVLSWLADVVTYEIVPCFFKTNRERIEFCYFIYKHRQSVDDFLLIIKLLPKSTPEYVVDYKMYQEILNEMELESDNCVQLPLNLYLKSDECSEEGLISVMFDLCGTSE